MNSSTHEIIMGLSKSMAINMRPALESLEKHMRFNEFVDSMQSAVDRGEISELYMERVLRYIELNRGDPDLPAYIRHARKTFEEGTYMPRRH